MNRVNGAAWIVLAWILCHGMTVKCHKVDSTPSVDTSPNQFWACSCPPGSYVQGTQYVHASANLCQDKNTSFIQGLNKVFSTTMQSEKSNEILTLLEVCNNCAIGCAKCKGPEETECMECMLGYFAFAIPESNSQKTKQEIVGKPAKTREIYEEEELLTMNLGIGIDTENSANEKRNLGLSNSDSDWTITSKREISSSQNLHNSREKTYFSDSMLEMQQYDDEESSGDIDQTESAPEIHILGNMDIPQVRPTTGNENTKSKPPLKKLNKLNQQIPASDTLYTSMTSYSCLVSCPHGFFNTSNRMCQSCHSECDGCYNGGPTNCINCRNYKQGTTCVSSCNDNGTEVNFDANCQLVIEEEDSIPAGYYAIPPLIILFVIACLALSYYRRRQKMKNMIPTWRPEGMHKTDLHSSESTFSRNHVDPKKYFYKGNKPHSHIALAEFKNNSNDQLKRKGNPYVYTERPLLPKYAHQTATNSPAWSACKDMSEPEDDFDPLYETPDNTMDLEALKRYQKRRRSSPSHVHFAHSSSKVKGISGGHEASVNSCIQTPKDLSDTDGYSTENEYNLAEDTSADIEAPYYQAPPLPVRNSPSTQDILIEDHIYVNIDEKN